LPWVSLTDQGDFTQKGAHTTHDPQGDPVILHRRITHGDNRNRRYLL
jgi:hypothetical protein